MTSPEELLMKVKVWHDLKSETVVYADLVYASSTIHQIGPLTFLISERRIIVRWHTIFVVYAQGTEDWVKSRLPSVLGVTEGPTTLEEFWCSFYHHVPFAAINDSMGYMNEKVLMAQLDADQLRKRLTSATRLLVSTHEAISDILRST